MAESRSQRHKYKQPLSDIRMGKTLGGEFGFRLPTWQTLNRNTNKKWRWNIQSLRMNQFAFRIERVMRLRWSWHSAIWIKSQLEQEPYSIFQPFDLWQLYLVSFSHSMWIDFSSIANSLRIFFLHFRFPFVCLAIHRCDCDIIWWQMG